MAAHKHTKKNIENLKGWLEKTKTKTKTKSVSATKPTKKNKPKKPVVVKEVKHEITHITKGLGKEIKKFVSDITKDVANTEKLINEFKNRANMLIDHIDSALVNPDAYTQKSHMALRDLRAKLSSSFEHVGADSQKVTKLKAVTNASKVKGYSDPHHHDLHLHLNNENTFKKKQAPNKTYRTHLNILKIATQKKKGS